MLNIDILITVYRLTDLLYLPPKDTGEVVDTRAGGFENRDETRLKSRSRFPRSRFSRKSRISRKSRSRISHKSRSRISRKSRILANLDLGFLANLAFSPISISDFSQISISRKSNRDFEKSEISRKQRF